MTKLTLLGTCPALMLAGLILNPQSTAAGEEHAMPSPPLAATAAEATNSVAKPDVRVDAGNPGTNGVSSDPLQEQQRSFLHAVEQIRQEANALARQNAESITGRLSVIEQTLAGERQRELEAIQKWNLYTLIIVGGFAMLGFLGLLLVAPFLVRSLNRMTDAATTLRLQDSFRTALPPPGGGEMALLANSAVNQSTARFLEAMERVERRLQQLEHSVQAPAPVLEARTNGGAKPAVAPRDLAPSAESPRPSLPPAVRTELVLEKGQALLHLGQAERALACFDEALAAEPDSAQVHIKRGQALEKLKRTDEALASYDRAIALEKSSTNAYLLKGSLLDQVGRFNEALQCYELALKAQQGDGAPTAQP
jgi:tetratricopeptide (TPR) repeat protein